MGLGVNVDATTDIHHIEILIPDKKLPVLIGKGNCWVVQNATGYHPGPVMPSSWKGALMVRIDQMMALYEVDL